MDQNVTKTVSLVVPNYNGGELFRRCMESLTWLQFPSNRLQVVIVDDGSTDGTGDWLESAEWPKHFEVIRHETNRGRSAARNTGLRKASGELLVLLDGDMTVQPDFIAAHHTAAFRPGVVAINGRVISGRDVRASKTLRYLYEFGGRGARQFDEETPLSFQFLLTNNMSIHRRVLDEVGEFDESYVGYGGEDTDLAIRIWKRFPNGIRYSAEPVAIDYDEPSPDEIIHKFHSYGRNNLMRLVRKNAEVTRALHADWVLGSHRKKLAGRVLFNRPVANLVRAVFPCVPFPLSNYVLRYLLGTAVITGLREGR